MHEHYSTVGGDEKRDAVAKAFAPVLSQKVGIEVGIGKGEMS
jgi:hypothetical protein